MAQACPYERSLRQSIHGDRKQECSGSEFRQANQLAGSACRNTGRSRASLAPACISARLLNIVKYVIIFVIYGYLVTVIYLLMFRANTAIGDFARITLTEHCDIVVEGKALDVCSRNSFDDRLVP